MRAIAVDVETRAVTEVEMPEGDAGLRFMQGFVGGFIESAGCVASRDGGDDVLYVDEEGLLKEKAGAFDIGLHQIFEGNGIIVGLRDLDGESVGAQISLEEVRKRVRFVRP